MLVILWIKTDVVYENIYENRSLFDFIDCSKDLRFSIKWLEKWKVTLGEM